MSRNFATETRGSSEPFVEVDISTAYAWNTSPLDDTGIIRSIPAIGHTLRFPFDIDMADMPALINNPSASVAYGGCVCG